ncbi:MAG: type II secretion system F family protein [Candidatus Omnitrophica bacterium]|nr:type II secretion system F family protein [Candidatus Omnitrophota bacterium]
MAEFQYKARDKQGKLVTGSMEAETENAVANKLKEMDYLPVTIEESSKEANFLNELLRRFKKVKLSEINMFTRQFATLQRAGVTILSSLVALGDQTSNKLFKKTLEAVSREIREGNDLSSALERHPKVFSPLYTNMLKSAEESGTLGESLERLSALGVHEEKIKMQIKSATRYPMMVVCAMAIAFFILIIFVIPRFVKIYSAANIVLPLPTRVLIWINTAVSQYWWLTGILLGIVIFSFYKYINTKGGRFLWDKFKLKVPVFGPLFLKMYMSRFCRATGTLMHSGVPILRVLELSSGGIGNAVIEKTINDIRTSVNEGEGIANPMKKSGMFAPVVTQMVAVGEDSGRVDELLLFVSDYYDSQIEYTIENFSSLIEPIMILVLGCGVLFMALGIFLPMWNLMAIFKR